ncbi:hypothetical protein ACE5I6_16350 [Yersinia ruckeri]|uniref:hypothetical protein n=1 Tax=Yersinia ruckeri TaxID=29486 RepID=UPI003D0F1FE9
MMDITKLREEFEEKFKMPKHVIRCGSGYAVTSYGAWTANSYLDFWEGWKASRESIALDLPDPRDYEYITKYAEGVYMEIRAAGIRIKGESE